MTPTIFAVLIGKLRTWHPCTPKSPSNTDCQLILILNSPSPSTSGKMTADSTILDVESTDQHVQSELDPLLGKDLKVLTKEEARSARAQFLALCWALFIIGWCDGSTGPLLPRIQEFYNVSWPIVFLWLFFNVFHEFRYEFCRSDLKQFLGYLYWVLRSVIGRCQLPYAIFMGAFVGAMINIPFNNKLGLGRVSIHADDLFFSKFHNFALQMLVVGPLFQITAFLKKKKSNFLLFPFRFLLYPFLLVGLERYFRLVLYIFIKICKLQVIMFSFDSF